MLLGRVIGTLVATRKESTLEGLTLLVVRACDVDGNPNGPMVVAADAVGAGVGEVVLYAAGSSARQTEVTNNRPVDATIMAIVDEVTMEGERRFTKFAQRADEAGAVQSTGSAGKSPGVESTEVRK